MQNQEEKAGLIKTQTMQASTSTVVELDELTQAGIKREVRSLVTREVHFLAGVIICLVISLLSALEGIFAFYSGNLQSSLILVPPSLVGISGMLILIYAHNKP